MLFAATLVVAPRVVQPVPTADTDAPPPGGGGPMMTTLPASRVVAPSSSAHACSTISGPTSANATTAVSELHGDLMTTVRYDRSASLTQPTLR